MAKVLLIDDIRLPSYIASTYGIDVTDVATNYDSAIQALQNGPWDLVLLDHDLGDFKDGKERTGYTIVEFLEANLEYLPKEIFLVTSNPVGRQKMQAVIDKLYGKP